MSIFDRINKNSEQIRTQIENETKTVYGSNLVADGLNNYFANTLVPKMKSSEYLRSATGWVYGCVGVIADEVAGIGLKMMKVQGDDQIEIDDHIALDVLYRANNAMTRFDLINLTFNYLELTGEAPWFISFKGGKPDQIILLRPDRLTVKPGKDGELIGGYKYRVYSDSGVNEIDLEAHEVIPLKYSDPDQPLRGKGPLQAAARTYDLDNYAETWNSQFFKNSASPSAALMTDKVLSTEVRERLNKKLEANYQGVDNSHKTMVLESGLKWEPISLTQKDMDFIEQQRFSRDKILAIFRVPRTALGITDDVNRANAEATDYVFAKRTIKPKMMRFVEQLNEFFLPLFGAGTENLFFTFDDPVPENVEQTIAKANAGVTNGYMTINEARELMGLDPIDGGDELRDPATFGPILNFNGKTLEGKRVKRNKPTRYQKQMVSVRSRGKKAARTKTEIYKTVVEDTIVPIVYSLLKKKYDTKKKLKTKAKKVSIPFKGNTPEEIKASKFAFQEKQLNVADQYEEKVINKLNTAFDAQLEVIQRGLDSGEKMKLDIKVETERYLKLLKPTMMALMKEQARLAFQIVGFHELFNDEAKANGKPLTFLQRLSQYFEVRTFRFATEIAKETNRKLQRQFSEAVKEGESIPQIKKRVTALFDDMKAYRSERIARTETIRASNFSAEEAYIESDLVEGKEWLATMDERTDDECVALDGKVIELRKSFKNRSDAGGYEAVQYPPLHPNCRCTLIPVIKA